MPKTSTLHCPNSPEIVCPNYPHKKMNLGNLDIVNTKY